MIENYHDEVKKTMLIVLILNMFMALIKIGYGYYSGILSISSDGFDSLLDVIANLVGLIAIVIACKPEDKDHPYGHDKIETFASIIIGLSLIIVSYEIITSAFDKFAHPVVVNISMVSFILMIITLIINIILSRYEKKQAIKLNSDLLLADSEHTKSDIMATSIVIIGLILMYFGLSIIDPVISLIIAILIIKTGIEILKSNLNILIDANVIPTANLFNIISKIDGVEDVHNIRTRGTNSSVYVDMHVVVNSHMSMKQAHDISECCENKIKQSYNEVKEVLIHLESEDGLNDALKLN